MLKVLSGGVFQQSTSGVTNTSRLSSVFVLFLTRFQTRIVMNSRMVALLPTDMNTNQDLMMHTSPGLPTTSWLGDLMLQAWVLILRLKFRLDLYRRSPW